MRLHGLGALALTLGLASCEATQYRQAPRDLFPDFQRGRDIVRQGWLGLSELESDTFRSGSDLPVVGGAFMQPLFGGEANLGIEGGLSFEFNGDVKSFSAGGGGLVVTVDNDLLITDFFAGPYGEI